MPGPMPLAVAGGSQSQTVFPPRAKSTTTTGPASPDMAGLSAVVTRGCSDSST